jgi:hypothetical protein
MLLTRFVMRTITRRAAQRFEQAARDPMGAQLHRLRALAARNADTEYGRKHGFAAIDGFERWCRQVPIVDYEKIRAGMERVAAGARNVFTAEDPVRFAQTSGTTGKAKLIPVTPSCSGRHHEDVMRTWLWHALQGRPRLYDGVVSLVSPAVEGHTPSGLPYGSTSGHIYANLPWLLRRAHLVPYSVMEIPDYEGKYYALMRFALARPATMIASANPSSIRKMCEKAEEHAERIVRDVRDGTLWRDAPIEPRLRALLEPRLRKDPRRARFLDKARSRRQGRLLPADYWPELQLIACWKGGTVGQEVARFPEWFDPDGGRPVPVRDWGYLSSEFRGSIPISDEGSHGVLAVGSNVYEFVEPADVEAAPNDPERWRCLTVADLQDGREYYVIVSTTGGLYRYDINDVIRVEGRHHATPQITFVRKGREQTNLTGEKVSANQVIDAVARAQRAAGVRVEHFRVEADAETHRYVVLAEFGGQADAQRQRAFLQAFDEQLAAVNLEYQAKRDSQRLHGPALNVMQRGWHAQEHKALGVAGKRVFQGKLAVLRERRAEDEAEEMLAATVELEPRTAQADRRQQRPSA